MDFLSASIELPPNGSSLLVSQVQLGNMMINNHGQQDNEYDVQVDLENGADGSSLFVGQVQLDNKMLSIMKEDI